MIRIALVLVLATTAWADENAKLLKLLEEDLDAMMRASPTWATHRGDRRFDDQLSDPSPKAARERLEHNARRLEALRAIDRGKLSEANWVNAALLEYALVRRLAAGKSNPWQQPITQMNGVQRDLPELPSRITFTKPEHFDDYVARLEKVPAYIDQIIANMRAGLAAGNTPPQVVMGPTVDQAMAHCTAAQAKNGQLHAMYPPFRGASPLAARARDVIEKQVVPAFRRLGTFLRDEYIPKCRKTIGARDGLDGIALYRQQLLNHTTLSLSPDEIHQKGIEEVARIRGEMTAVIARTDAPDKEFAAFTNYLRTNPRFYHETKDDLLAGYRDIAKRVDAWMPRLFGRLPRLTYGVREMPGFIAAASATAYYYSGSLKTGEPGYFVANTFRLDSRPKYEMIPLTLHEAVPGHHHQYALAAELEDLPEWRTVMSYTAFGEGWALYAERLGLEMGDLYKDPYDDFGRLSYEMWRAMRLVVDTGIHAKDWSRERAVAYMLGNSALTKQNVEREVDRYIAWPGQATAYKIGELKIRKLRAEAEAALGDRFDLRAFHDAVLQNGSIPLGVLEANIATWVASVLER